MNDTISRRGLLLAARVRTLRRSLNDVRRSLVGVEEKRATIRDLLPTKKVFDLLGLVDDAAESIRREFELSSDNDRVEPHVDAIKEHTKQTRQELRRVEATLRTVGRVQRATEDALEQDFLRELDTWIADTTTLLGHLSSEGGSIPAMVRQAWATQQKLLADSEDSFAEYVELLRGIAMRDSGFDNGIPAIADALIQNRIPGWYSLTIAGHKPHGELTRAKFVHLGFPEWTPWALPLAAYDVGRMEISDPDFAAFIADKAAEGYGQTEIETALADAIATYLVGPAYVCAVMVIQLDPGRGGEQRRLAERRIERMLQALRTLHDPALPTERPLASLADNLAAIWAEALAEMGEEEVGDQAPPGHPVDVETFETWLDLRRFESYRMKAMAATDWAGLENIATALRDEESIESDDLIAVLNAAWLVRIEDHMDMSGDDQSLENLRARVTTALDAIARRLSGGPDHGARTAARHAQGARR